ncbi:MAG: bifunctional phosphoribosyl-AMP cyclohydrolase/phosphoribosyl-ATP diphosphatase HisIE [Lachnospiraceae bacterium]|nr:bifunctional phosphoribosyl-AMP cyclohydrolase/phosphoribosyl-ATP diphosphatase HisIE [Lachnospiraceae bacterium]MDY3223992.1 bifunctional phosphoribosyl-AMP cyclohydrolase/phosphoribosyl-ATP diphosphatase HisIE [Lachnospiraceae bacterium]
MNKKLVASLFLYEKEAVTNFDDLTVISEDPVSLAKMYSEQHADELIIFDLSMGDKEHDEALDIIKEICNVVEIPVIGAGNVKRTEDIKKLLYAGCQKAALNYSKDSNVALTQEVSERFGKEKIVIATGDLNNLTDFFDVIEAYACEVIYLGKDNFKAAYAASPIPLISWVPEISLDKLMETLRNDKVSGVMGTMVNENAAQFASLKMLLKDNGIPMSALEAQLCWEEFKKNSDGFVPVIVQDYRTEVVLMLAYMNRQAYEKTLSTGKMTYWSRSRDCLWVKGETSGHFQYVKSLTADCDKDTILAKVSQVGAACHTGKTSCFFNTIMEKEDAAALNPLKVFEDVFAVIMDRKEHPKEGSYTNYLFDKGIDKILKKMGEEATEIVIAAKNPNPNEIKYEISDFLYHMMVLMAEKGVTWDEITEELSKR